MSAELSGRRIAVIATDGFEEAELTEPRKAVTEAGATVDVVSIGPDPIQAMNGDIDKADTYEVQAVVSTANAADYDALIMPGGTINADSLRVDADVRAFVTAFFDAGKP
ncbi:MAG: DJ-1/PfpI family protein, partial [Pseudonocardia sp.]|nr:DJ-1/PfpI family protein [Pseudonocardia sp.]